MRGGAVQQLGTDWAGDGGGHQHRAGGREGVRHLAARQVLGLQGQHSVHLDIALVNTS